MKKTEIKISKIFSKNHIKIYFMGLVCSVALLGTACHNNDDDDNVAASTSTTSVTTQGTFNRVDRQFIDSAAVAGLAEVQLGELAASKATNDSVRAFGQRMMIEHTTSNNQLLQLAHSKGITPPTQLDTVHQALKDKLSAMSGNDFDVAYMQSQITDHNKAINLYQTEVNNSTGDPQVRGYASSNLPILNSHLSSAQSILNSLNGGSTSGTTSGTSSGTTSSTTSATASGTTDGSTNGTSSGTTMGSTSGTTSGATTASTSSGY